MIKRHYPISGAALPKEQILSFTEQLQAQQRKKDREQESKTVSSKPKEKTKLSFNEKYEYEQLEKQIPQLDARKAELTNLMNSGKTDHEKLMAWSKELEGLINELEQKTERWFELAAFVDSWCMIRNSWFIRKVSAKAGLWRRKKPEWSK